MDSTYKNILKTGFVDKAASETPFDENAWLKWFKSYSDAKKGHSLKAMRRVISNGTLDYCRSGILDTVEKSVVHNYEKEVMSDIPRLDTDTRIELYSEDCLDTEFRLRNTGLNPCVLNMASTTTPGGGWLEGAGAQEESLFRRSNYFECLTEDLYPLPEFGGVYSPSVTIFRNTEAKGYPFLEKTRQVAFVAAATYRQPVLIEDGSDLLPAIFDATKRKIRSLLHIALLHSHDSIVLSAFGCGAYRNPPRAIARAFRQVILGDPAFINRFRLIAFAIFDDHNAGQHHNPDGNFKPFHDEFISK
jgi:uncharacterized protein (TIGR02452 family)